MEVTLSGSALTGIGEIPQGLMAQLPQTVKLGRQRLMGAPMAPKLEDYTYKLANIPAAVDWYTKAQASLSRMYLNDVKGCCVIAGTAHALGVWSANDTDSGPIVLATDQEIDQQYVQVCGPNDRGCNIANVLNYARTYGFQAGGKRYKIAGYASINWLNKELVQTAIQIGGALKIGFNLPQAWTNSAVWAPTNSPIIGGHDVTPCGYGVHANADGVVVSSWGRLYLFTWEAFCSNRYIEECYFIVPSVLWTGTDGIAPSKVNLSGLMDVMQKLSNGQIPDLQPDPVDPDPPVSAPNYSGKVTVSGTIPTALGNRPVTLTGTVDLAPSGVKLMEGKIDNLLELAPKIIDLIKLIKGLWNS